MVKWARGMVRKVNTYAVKRNSGSVHMGKCSTCGMK